MPSGAVRAPADTPAAQALAFIIDLAVRCQQRGGYSLDEAVALHAAQAYFQKRDRDPADDARDGSRHLNATVRLLEKSQSLGKLSLEEAWTAYNAIQLFARPPAATAAAGAGKNGGGAKGGRADGSGDGSGIGGSNPGMGAGAPPPPPSAGEHKN